MGEAIGAFKSIAAILAVMLAVFAATLVVNVNSAAVALVVSAVMDEVFAVMLAVFAATLVVNVNSAAVALVVSAVIAVELAVILAVFAFTVAVNVVTSVAFAFKAKPGTVGDAAVPPKSPVN